MSSSTDLPIPTLLRVQADDGIELHVEVQGNGGLTIVFVNGINCTLRFWGRQRKALASLGQLVFFDHRGHGRSDQTSPANANMDQLGRDLAAVIEATCPQGPIIVVAHSMGAIAVPALAKQRPELFGTTIGGVALIDTIPGRWGDVFFDLPRFINQPMMCALYFAEPVLRRYFTTNRGRVGSFSSLSGQLATVVRADRMPGGRVLARTNLLYRAFSTKLGQVTRPTPTLLGFIASTATCDYRSALGTLGNAEALVIAGEDDRFIPLRHKKAVATRIPGSRLEIVPRGGHLSSLKRPAMVNGWLRDLTERVTARFPDPRTCSQSD